MSALTYCGEIVKRYDPDRFMITMAMPAERREALWALFAFNHEIAKTREVVSETTLGLIRLQWWRDALASFYDEGTVPNHEILQALTGAIKTYDLPKKHFDDLIYAREFDLEDVLPTSLEGLENYADYTVTPLTRLALQILGQSATDEEIKACSVTYAVTGLLRSVATHAAQQRCYLPEDMLKEHDLTQYDLYKFVLSTDLQKIIFKIILYIEEKYTVTPSVPIYLNSMKSLSTLYLRQIKRLKADVFSPRLQYSPAFLHLRFLWQLKKLTK